jgi:hypothetical protein
MRLAGVFRSKERLMNQETMVVGFGLDFLPLLLGGLLIVVLVIVWVAGNALSSGNGGTVDRAHRVAQLYGYTVCLVAVVTVLFAIPSIINSLFKLSDPLQAEGSFEPILSSFDAYKATWERARGFAGRDEARPVPPPSEAELRQGYEALRADRIASNRYEARRSLVTSTFLLLLALGLFAGHWRWLRRRALDGSAEAAA